MTLADCIYDNHHFMLSVAIEQQAFKIVNNGLNLLKIW
jgi:hypothetical protein